MLANEIRGLYSSYYVLNTNRATNLNSLTNRIKELANPMNYSLFNPRFYLNYGKSKLKPKNPLSEEHCLIGTIFRPIEAWQLMLYFINLFLFFVNSYVFYVYEWVFNSNIQYGAVLNFFLLMNKSLWAKLNDFIYNYSSVSDLKNWTTFNKYLKKN